MDINVLRSATTLLMFLVFIGIVFWAWKGSRRAGFDAAAQLPFVEDSVEGLTKPTSQGEKQ